MIFFSCRDNGKASSKDIILRDSAVVSSHDNLRTNTKNPVIDIVYETENIRLYGDTTMDKEKILYAALKFEPYIGFEDFKVDIVDHKKYRNLDLKSNKDAGNFRTRLREGYSADTANFAGHYSFVYWGCGSPCKSGLLIDRKTGKIYDSPGASLGYLFKVDSRMLIVNPPDPSGFYDDCSYCKPMIYIFDEKAKTFNEQQIKTFSRH
jgi:hypothetical protein